MFPEINVSPKKNIEEKTKDISTENTTVKEESVDGNYELITLVQSELNRHHKILMAAEVDCIDEKGHYVEVKTQKYIAPKIQQHRLFGSHGSQHHRRGGQSDHSYSRHYHQSSWHHDQARHHPYGRQLGRRYEHRNVGDNVMPIIPWYKSMKIWIQSYLAGVNSVVMGFRDQKGFVVDIRKVNLNYFENKINYFDKRKREKIFKGNVCLNFTDRVLSFIKQHVCTTGESGRHRIIFNKPWDKLVLYST